MAVELVTGTAGVPHIDGDDVGHLIAGLAGPGSYVLRTGSMLSATMPSANRVTVAAGDAVHHGRHFRVSAPETVAIESGAQGQGRSDLVCLRYARTENASGQAVEVGSLAVLKGTPTSGAPADPEVPAGSALEGAAEDWMPLYRVTLDGVAAAAPVALFDVLVPAAEAWAALTRATVTRSVAAGCDLSTCGGLAVLQATNVTVGRGETRRLGTLPEGSRPGSDAIGALDHGGFLKVSASDGAVTAYSDNSGEFSGMVAYALAQA